MVVAIKRVSVIAAVAALGCTSAMAQSADTRNVSVDAAVNASVVKDLSLADLTVGELPLPELPQLTLTPQEVIEQLELYLLKSDVILGQFDMPAIGGFLPAMPGLSFGDMIDCQLQVPLAGEIADACEALRPNVSQFFTQRLSNGLQFPMPTHLDSIIDASAVREATEALGDTLGNLGGVADLGGVAESLEAITSGSLPSTGSVTERVEGVAENTRSALNNVDSSFREAVAAGESFVASLDETTSSLASQVGATGGLDTVREAVGRLRGSKPAGNDDAVTTPLLNLDVPDLAIPSVDTPLAIPSGEDVVRAIEQAGLTLPSTEIIEEILRSGNKEPLIAARSTLEDFLRSTEKVIIDGALSDAGRTILEADILGVSAAPGEEVTDERRLAEEEEAVEAEEEERRLAEDEEAQAEEVPEERRLAEEEEAQAEEVPEKRRLAEEEEAVESEEVADRRLGDAEDEEALEAEVTEDRRLAEEAVEAEEVTDRRLGDEADEDVTDSESGDVRALQDVEADAVEADVAEETVRVLQDDAEAETEDVAVRALQDEEEVAEEVAGGTS